MPAVCTGDGSSCSWSTERSDRSLDRSADSVRGFGATLGVQVRGWVDFDHHPLEVAGELERPDVLVGRRSAAIFTNVERLSGAEADRHDMRESGRADLHAVDRQGRRAALAPFFTFLDIVEHGCHCSRRKRLGGADYVALAREEVILVGQAPVLDEQRVTARAAATTDDDAFATALRYIKLSGDAVRLHLEVWRAALGYADRARIQGKGLASLRDGRPVGDLAALGKTIVERKDVVFGRFRLEQRLQLGELVGMLFRDIDRLTEVGGEVV